MTPTRDPRPYTMWCFGLSEQDMACIRQCAGTECIVTARDIPALHDEAALVTEEPTLLWVHADVWHREYVGQIGGSAQSVPKVMILDEQKGEEDLDRFIVADAEHVLRGPLTAAGVYRILRRTLEVCSIHQDMGRMTREILLNRELLTRKTEVLNFLIEADTQLRSSRKMPELLIAARKSFTTLLPIRSLHAAVWQQEQGAHTIDLFLEGAMPDSASGKTWQELLLDAAKRLEPGDYVVRRAERLMPGAELLPGSGHILLLPLCVHDVPIGALMLLLAREVTFSRDQNLALNMTLTRLSSLIRMAESPILRPRIAHVATKQSVEFPPR